MILCVCRDRTVKCWNIINRNDDALEYILTEAEELWNVTAYSLEKLDRKTGQHWTIWGKLVSNIISVECGYEQHFQLSGEGDGSGVQKSAAYDDMLD